MKYIDLYIYIYMHTIIPFAYVHWLFFHAFLADDFKLGGISIIQNFLKECKAWNSLNCHDWCHASLSRIVSCYLAIFGTNMRSLAKLIGFCCLQAVVLSPTSLGAFELTSTQA